MVCTGVPNATARFLSETGIAVLTVRGDQEPNAPGAGVSGPSRNNHSQQQVKRDLMKSADAERTRDYVDAVLTANRLDVSRPAASADTRGDTLDARPFQFTGSAGEYFRIWIVNLALSVVTLGALLRLGQGAAPQVFLRPHEARWPHVRLPRVSHRHPEGPPRRLRRVGRAGCPGIHWRRSSRCSSICRSWRSCRSSSCGRGAFTRGVPRYRGIRFGFDGTVGESYGVFLGLPLLVPFTLWLLYPYVVKRQRQFVVNNSRHGRSSFALSLDTGSVFGIYAVGVVACVCWMMLVMVPAIALAVSTGAGQEPSEILAVFAPLLIYAGFGAVAVGVRTVLENRVWNNTTIDGHAFSSRLHVGRMLVLYATNFAAIAGTLGLAVPWARIRLARYRAENLALLPGGPLASHAASIDDETGAVGFELGEAMEVDFGL